MNGNEDSSSKSRVNVKAEQRLLVIWIKWFWILRLCKRWKIKDTFCVDNLPPPLIAKLLELASQQTMRAPLAIGLDAEVSMI